MSYFEAVNTETLKNSFQRFQEEGITQVVRSKDTKIPPRLRLSPEWMLSRDPITGSLIASGRLWNFIDKIAVSRREGKNRRDGATVSTRVVTHADSIGRTLFQADGAPKKLSSEDAALLEKRVKDDRKRREVMSKL